ncbi:hypothetical protein MBLNU459_g0146t1 [Dothideomycetes sp. NU459]
MALEYMNETDLSIHRFEDYSCRLPAPSQLLSPSSGIVPRESLTPTAYLSPRLFFPSPPSYAYPDTLRNIPSISNLSFPDTLRNITPISNVSFPHLGAVCADSQMTSTRGFGTSAAECYNFPWPSHDVMHPMTCDGREVMPTVFAKMEKGFFMCQSDSTWTCYRRNYFSVSCWFELSPYISNGKLYVNNRQVRAMGMRLAAAVDGPAGKSIELVQHTPKRDQGPKAAVKISRVSPSPPSIGRLPDHALNPRGVYHVPTPTFNSAGTPPTPFLPLQHLPDSPSPSRVASPSSKSESSTYSYASLPVSQTPPSLATTHTFERVQFKAATANNGKRRATQQYFHLIVELYADVRDEGADNPRWSKIACRYSDKVVVRGRSPSHYKDENHRGAPAAGRGGRGGSAYGGSTGSYGGTPHRNLSIGSGNYGMHPGNLGNFRAVQQYGLPASPARSISASSRASSFHEVVQGDAKHPMEPTLTPEEESMIRKHEYYQYMPNTLYGGTPIYRNLGRSIKSPNSTLQDDDDASARHWLRDQYPQAIPGSQWNNATCGRFKPFDTSRGYYPNLDPDNTT